MKIGCTVLGDNSRYVVMKEKISTILDSSSLDGSMGTVRGFGTL